MKKFIFVLVLTLVLVGIGTTDVKAVPYTIIDAGGGGGCDSSYTTETDDVLLYRNPVVVESFDNFSFVEYREKTFKTTTYAYVNGVCTVSYSYSTQNTTIVKDESIFDSSDIVIMNYDYSYFEEYEMRLYDGDILIIKEDNEYFGITSYKHYEYRDYLNDKLNLPSTITSNTFTTVDQFGNTRVCVNEGSPKLHVMPSIGYLHSEANKDNDKYKCDGFTSDETFEIIVDSDGFVVTEAINMGTYNYADSSETSSKEHRIQDVIPWLVFGNLRSDISRSVERFSWYENSTTDLRFYRGSSFDTELDDGYYVIFHFNYNQVSGVPFGDVDLAISNFTEEFNNNN